LTAQRAPDIRACSAINDALHHDGQKARRVDSDRTSGRPETAPVDRDPCAQRDSVTSQVQLLDRVLIVTKLVAQSVELDPSASKKVAARAVFESSSHVLLDDEHRSTVVCRRP